MAQTTRVVTLLTVVTLFLCTAAAAAAAAAAARGHEAEKRRPRNVVVDVLNDTTVRLSWERPTLPDDCPISRYTIRLRPDGGTRRSKTWKVDGSRQTVTLYGLDPGVVYHVRVLAVVCHGKGRPSPWVGVRTARSVEQRVDRGRTETLGENDHNQQQQQQQQETSVPGKPTYVRTRTFSDSVMVTWLAPDDGDIVRGYMIGYGEGVPDVNWRYVDASSSNVTIHNLKPATQYIISLRAFNNMGKSQVIYDLIYTRELTVAGTPSPIDLRSRVLSPSTLWLEWTDPSLERGQQQQQQPTDSRYYNVHYRQQVQSSSSVDDLTLTTGDDGNDGGGRTAVGRTLSVVVKATHVVFYDLRPGTRYEFKVRTVKDAVASDFSAPIFNKTIETAPSSPPRAVTVSLTGESGTVDVTWRAPRFPNGDITGYTVLYTQNSDQPTDNWNSYTVDRATTHATLTNLTVNSTYHIRVQAHNSVGHSPLSSNSVFYVRLLPVVADVTETDDGGRNRSEQLNTLPGNASSLTPSQDTGAVRQSARLVQHMHDGGLNQVDATDNAGTTPASKMKRDGQAAVEMLSSHSQSASSRHHVDRQVPQTTDVAFRAVVQHHVTAFVTWSVTEPTCVDSVTSQTPAMLGYRLRYNDLEATTSPMELELSVNLVTLEGLRPAAEYWYQLRRLFVDGTHSAWSERQFIQT